MTEKRYLEEVEELSKLDPVNIFLKSLRNGHSIAAEAYLTAAWKIVEAKKQANATQDVAKKPTHPDIINDLFKRKGHLNREMRKIKATTLMVATTPLERKRIMLQLDEMQNEWAGIQQQIRLWEITKELPIATMAAHNAEATLKERISDLNLLTDIELTSRLNTARACYSRKKTQVEKYPAAVMDMLHPQHRAWQKAEAKMCEYEREKLYLETELNRRKEGSKKHE
jgi:hypothetical protein